MIVIKPKLCFEPTITFHRRIELKNKSSAARGIFPERFYGELKTLYYSFISQLQHYPATETVGEVTTGDKWERDDVYT